MYEFHYKYFKRKYDAKFFLEDTDSLVYEIKTGDVYEHFYEYKNLFDLSDFPWDSKFSDPVNKKVISITKDETEGKKISEFVGLKSRFIL